MKQNRTAELTASLEDYLEAIYLIVEEKRAARAKEIAERLSVGRSSVTGALRALADRELVNYAPYDLVTLTERGREVAAQIFRRHEVLRDFFIKVLAIDEDEADVCACKMEHEISQTVVERFVEFVDFIERCPNRGTRWIEGFGYYCERVAQDRACEQCTQAGLMTALEKEDAGQCGGDVEGRGSDAEPKDGHAERRGDDNGRCGSDAQLSVDDTQQGVSDTGQG